MAIKFSKIFKLKRTNDNYKVFKVNSNTTGFRKIKSYISENHLGVSEITMSEESLCFQGKVKDREELNKLCNKIVLYLEEEGCTVIGNIEKNKPNKNTLIRFRIIVFKEQDEETNTEIRTDFLLNKPINIIDKKVIHYVSQLCLLHKAEKMINEVNYLFSTKHGYTIIHEIRPLAS